MLTNILSHKGRVLVCVLWAHHRCIGCGRKWDDGRLNVPLLLLLLLLLLILTVVCVWGGDAVNFGWVDLLFLRGFALSADELAGDAAMMNPGVSTVSAAIKDPTIQSIITDAVRKTNNNEESCVSNASKIQRFCILPIDFSVATDELTPTLKLKRSVVCEK